MNLLIFAGLYQFRKEDFLENSFIISLDKATQTLVDNAVIPNLALGDFDSLEQEKLDYLLKKIPNIVFYKKDKDFTDLELIFTDKNLFIDFSLYKKIIIYGALGSRVDHSFVALNIMIKNQHLPITIINDYSKMQILKAGRFKIRKEKYHYFSLYAIAPSNISIDYSKFPLSNYDLLPYDNLVTSNEFLDDEVVLDINFGNLILIRSLKN